jgi:glycosyltransferase involved in cell wall biosynthesis
VVVGKGNNKYLTKVRDLIKYYKLDDYIYFFDKITNEYLIAVYDESFALIYPSVYEGFGIPVIESLFRQKPVITSDISSLPEAAGPGAMLVNPYSPEDIRRAMICLHDTKCYQNLCTEGYQYVSDRFSSEKTAEHLMANYRLWCESRNSDWGK